MTFYVALSVTSLVIVGSLTMPSTNEIQPSYLAPISETYTTTKTSAVLVCSDQAVVKIVSK